MSVSLSWFVIANDEDDRESWGDKGEYGEHGSGEDADEEEEEEDWFEELDVS